MCPLHGNMTALCNNLSIKRQKVTTQNPEVKTTTTQTSNQDIDVEYAALLAGDLRIERKRKAPWNEVEDVMNVGFNLGYTMHHNVPTISLGPILKKRFKR